MCRRPLFAVLGVLAIALLATACGTASAESVATSSSIAIAAEPPTEAMVATTTSTISTTTTTVVAAAETTTSTTAATEESSPFARPEWLGTRELPRRADGWGQVQPTPPELVNRRFETIDLLPPPVGDAFTSTMGPVPDDVLARSSWSEECPVAADDLVYLTMSHWGFDGEHHTGEMIVHAEVGFDVVQVFRALHRERFPIEQMRVIGADEIDPPPSGDWNRTSAFACRRSVGSGNWSQHAYGLAIDINPFHNPYLKGDLVIPELASAYVDRSDVRPGMIIAGDVVQEAFAEIGWGWGGYWSSLKDWMHFSRSGN